MDRPRVADLEAALAAAWDRDTLVVYADHLAELGDPRGELIALDLELEQRSTPELVARRTSLLTGWLGRLVPSDPHAPWLGDSFRCGFVEDLVIDGHDPGADDRLAAVLASPLSPYLKRVTVRGAPSLVERVLAALAEHRHAWLAELAIRASADDEHVIDDATIARFIAATPRLELLDVQGSPVLDAFPHPALRRLRVTGWTALPSLFAASDAPAFATVTALDFAFYEPLDPAYYAPPVARITEPADLRLPALRTLDLARNDPDARRAPVWDDDLEDLDELADQAELSPLRFLAAQSLRHQLTHLRLPVLRSRQELDELAALVGAMPALAEVVIARGHYYRAPELANTRARFVRPPPWPWPPPEQIALGEHLHVVAPGSRSGDEVALADAVAAMERAYEQLAADARYAWTRFWVFVDELGRGEWKQDARHAWTDERAFPADLLVAALEACDIGGTGGWRELRDELRVRRPLPAGAVATIQRIRLTGPRR